MGLFVPGSADSAYLDWMRMGCSQSTPSSATSGSCPFPMPNTVGGYEFRVFGSTGRLGISNTVTVQ